jgi:hypothetical protein
MVFFWCGIRDDPFVSVVIRVEGVAPKIGASRNSPQITSIRNSVISSIAYRTPSRPVPDCFTPPYGA